MGQLQQMANLHMYIDECHIFGLVSIFDNHDRYHVKQFKFNDRIIMSLLSATLFIVVASLIS